MLGIIDLEIFVLPMGKKLLPNTIFFSSSNFYVVDIKTSQLAAKVRLAEMIKLLDSMNAIHRTRRWKTRTATSN